MAQEKIEAGQATSIRDAARQIAEETGEGEDAVKMKIIRGRKQVEHGVPFPQATDTTEETPELEKLEKPTHGGARPGAAGSNEPPEQPTENTTETTKSNEIKREPAKDGTMREGRRD